MEYITGGKAREQSDASIRTPLYTIDSNVFVQESRTGLTQAQPQSRRSQGWPEHCWKSEHTIVMLSTFVPLSVNSAKHLEVEREILRFAQHDNWEKRVTL